MPFENFGGNHWRSMDVLDISVTLILKLRISGAGNRLAIVNMSYYLLLLRILFVVLLD